MKNALKSAVWTLLWSTLATSGLAVLGWLNDAMEWATDMANGGDRTVHFPDPEVLYGIALGAVFGITAGVIVFLIRWGQNRGTLPGESPQFDTTDKP